MRWTNVIIEAIGYVLPEQRLSSAELEEQLAPVYQRLRLPRGRLEGMTGIAERRLWPPDVLPSQPSTQAAQLALQAAGRKRTTVGALVHASVCRDQLEPATACRVHHLLDLPQQCLLYDVSNACLGMLNGMLQVACLIELGQIEAGLVVGTESSRSLLETTTRWLLEQPVTRQSIKPSLASLTIGSAACAVVLAHRDCTHGRSRLDVSTWRAETDYHHLCQSTKDDAIGHAMQPLMTTEAELLLDAGLAVGKATYAQLQTELSRYGRSLTGTVCHQVGRAHRQQILSELNLTPQRDFITYPWLGNTGSVALPISLAIASERGFFSPGDYVGLMGIGSGINCLMLTIDWQQVPVAGCDLSQAPALSTQPSSI